MSEVELTEEYERVSIRTDNNGNIIIDINTMVILVENVAGN